MTYFWLCVTDEHTEGGGYRGPTDDKLAERVHLPVQRLREGDQVHRGESGLYRRLPAASLKR